MRQLIVTADDFGLDRAVNEAVERAHRDGILSTASLMVGAPEAADAVRRAKLLPRLHVGLHLALVDAAPVLRGPAAAPLLRRSGEFDRNMLRAGVRFFLLPRVRAALAAEIRAQFAAFAATGLALDHVNAHKHMHIHPTVARMIVEIGRDYGMRAVRVPAEPVGPLNRAWPGERRRAPLYGAWTGRLRRRLERAGLAVNDHLFGIAWSGAMVEERLLALIPQLPEGVSEIYFHPASERTPALVAMMPDYRHTQELAALLSPAVRERLAQEGVRLVDYGSLAACRS
ncbi:MAG TPA: hopanoid biosynthesis-associated protein HpnK [Stellaceae bacterium]|nr:hopanoid biosynthesis-associated protein HpnK [Stellaceae bacterium]